MIYKFYISLVSTSLKFFRFNWNTRRTNIICSRYQRKKNMEIRYSSRLYSFKQNIFCPNGSDGMTIDDDGNVYLTSGEVWVYNPKGELIKEIEAPERPSNVCFGGNKRNILFITARKGVYSLKMKVRGVD